jgi:hypothetical protein
MDDTQYNGLNNAMQRNIMLSLAFYIVMLGVIMLSVTMLCGIVLNAIMLNAIMLN